MIKNTTSAFDIDFKYGDLKQDELSEILTGSKVEVKADRQAYRTGNVFVEYESRGKPSGIAVTQADYWVFILDGIEMFIGISTKRLKDICRSLYNSRKVNGGDDLTSYGVLVPLDKLRG